MDGKSVICHTRHRIIVCVRGANSVFPTGNFYSISNETDQDAKIFFSQGCETMPEVADAELEPQPA